MLQKRKWEGGLTIDRNTWGYVRNHQLSEFLDIHEIISHFASVIRYCGVFKKILSVSIAVLLKQDLCNSPATFLFRNVDGECRWRVTIDMKLRCLAA